METNNLILQNITVNKDKIIEINKTSKKTWNEKKH